MGLFTQEIVLAMQDTNNLMEKISLPLQKGKIDLIVKKGTVAYINGMKYRGQAASYALDPSIMGGRKKDSIDAFLFPDKQLDSVKILFFAGSHKCRMSYIQERTVCEFGLVGECQVIIDDYVKLADHYGKTMSKNELVDDINASYRQILGDEISNAADKYVTADSTEVDLQSNFTKIKDDVFRGSRQAGSAFMNMGLIIVPGSIVLKINSLGNTDSMMNQAIDIINTQAINSLSDADKEKEYQRQLAELEAERQHEVDLEKAKHTSVQETTINNNNNAAPEAKGDHFCTKCGNKVPAGALFCPGCGAKQE